MSALAKPYRDMPNARKRSAVDLGGIAPPRKPLIGSPHNRYEREAERVALAAIEVPTADSQCEERPLITHCQADADFAEAPSLEISDRDQPSADGRPLSGSIRKPMERILHFDLGAVKVHNDAHSDELNRMMGAAAFTAGWDIFFRRGAYDPETRQGQHLIAHELTHVAQQNGTQAARAAAPVVQCLPVNEAIAAAKSIKRFPKPYSELAFQKWVLEKKLGRGVKSLDRYAIHSEFDKWVNETDRKALLQALQDFSQSQKAEETSAPTERIAKTKQSKRETLKLEIEAPDPAPSHVDAVSETAFEDTGETAFEETGETASLESFAQEAFAKIDEESLPETTADIAQYVPAIKTIRESQTRVGFEIEPGASLLVDVAYLDLAKRLVNETLAETAYLEFVIDDPQKSGLLQVEFRTKPLTTGQLKALKGIAKEIRRSIINFPLFALTQGLEAAESALKDEHWVVTDEFRQLVPHIRKSRKALLPVRLAQHVTHSIPLAGFANLSPQQREFIIPGSGAADTVPKLIVYFFGLQLRTLDKKTKTILITTTGRNTNRFNVKTAIDTLIGLLPPEKADEVLRGISERVPTHVQVEKQTPQEIRNPQPEAMEDLPQGGFPRFNTGFISAEEKLKPPLFDDLRNDIRVLVEHRTDELVDAVNKAALGNGAQLAPYLELFAKLDKVQGDDTFQHWFWR